MIPARRRFLILLAILPVVLLTTTMLYMVGMEHLEANPRDFWTSLAWAAETITTTGYGADGRWEHPVMVIFRYGPAVESLLTDLENADVDTLIVETDEARARHLIARKLWVVYGSTIDLALRGARLDTARSLIANGSDEENASAILLARQLELTGEILALVEEPYLRQPMSLAGANAVYTPRHLVATALAARASSRIQPRVVDVQQLGRQGDVDITGDILEPDVLERAQPKKAQAIVLALDSDSATLFATVVLREQAPNVPIIARVNEVHNVERIHRAGADFALSFSQVSGQILARHLLGQEAVSVEAHLKVQRFRAPAALIGHAAAKLGIRERTGCSVVAVERDDDVRIDLGPDFVFERSDDVYVCGSPEGMRRFNETFS